MKKILLLLLLSSLFFVITGCSDKGKKEENAQDQKEKISGAKVFEACVVCHGQDGKTPALGVSEAIAGQSEAILIHKIEAYKKGTMDQYGMGDKMHQEVQYLTEDEIKSVAEYITSLQ